MSGDCFKFWGGMSEVVAHEDNGLLFESGDADGLADLIRHLYENKDILGTLAENSRQPKSVEEYTKELLIIYEEIFEEKR